MRDGPRLSSSPPVGAPGHAWPHDEHEVLQLLLLLTREWAQNHYGHQHFERGWQRVDVDVDQL